MKALGISVWLVTLPATSFAQAAIAGRVTDSTGAPLNRVTVEASSAALIERLRTVVTDNTGRYRIENLRPGIYTVRFSRVDWTPREQTGVELTGPATATVDATLSIGSIAESITVRAEFPVVDAYSAQHAITMSGDLIRSLPAARAYNALLPLIPGILTNVNDTVTGTATTSFPIHGGRVNEGRLSLDGLTVGSPPSGNSATSWVVDTGSTDEVTFMTQGGLGESETAGLVMNVVSRAGGNVHHGSSFVSVSGGRLESDNLTPALQAQGVTAATPLTGVYDVSASAGGPIRTDRLWYFLAAHVGGSRKDSASIFANLNAGDPAKWLYAPDVSQREYSDRTFENANGRLTWQVTPRNKISGYLDAQALCRTCTGATPGLAEPARVSPEAVGVLGRPLYVSQVTWSSPITSRLLADVGFGSTYFGVGNFERDPNPTRGLIRVAEQCASGCAANGNIPGLVYRSQDFSVAYTGSYEWKGSLSFVTGGHSLKIGYLQTLMTDDRTWMTNDQNLTYRVDNGVPNQLTESISPWVNDTRVAWNALYAQHQWTVHRLTLQGALRFDHAWSWFPAQQEGPSRFLSVPILVPETRGVDSYKDLSPRVSAAYDVFGSGGTVVKIHAGRYLEGAGSTGTYANTNPTLRLPQTTSMFGTAGVTRAWTDGNQNFTPDCDLLNPAAQDLRPIGGDLCGVVSNTQFGQNVLTNNFAPTLLRGWGIRPSDWNLGASIEHRLGPRSAVAVSYIRRWFRGFTAVDNRALQPSDLTPFSLVAPLDSRLPDGGGYVISGLYDVVPEKAGLVDNLVADSGTYGRWSQHFDGLDVTANLRFGNRFFFTGGTSTGETVADNCDVRAHLPELATTTTGTSPFGAGLNGSAVTPVSPYCHVSYGVLTQVRGLASYLLPKADVQVAATFQSKPGALLAANYAVPNSAVVPSLGRSLSGKAANVTVNLVEPGTMYGDRINQLDVRVAKLLRYSRGRLLLAVDAYNLLNASTVLTYDNTFVPGGKWLQPLSILTPRLFKVTVDVDF